MRTKQQHQGFGGRVQSAFFTALSILVVSTILASGASLAARESAEESELGTEVSGLTVIQDGARVAISWRAGSRADIVGFNLWREENGVRTQVNSNVIAGSALAGGQALESPSFHVDDTLSSPTSYVQYWIESVDSMGERSWEGPVARTFGSLAVESAERALFSGLEAVTATAIPGIGTTGSSIVSAPGIGALQPTALAAKASRTQLGIQASLAAGAGLKIFVSQEGWYRISRAEMAAAGFDPGSDPARIELYTSATAQPIVVNAGADGRFDSTDTIEFYSLGLDTISTGARTYWLRTGLDGVRLAAPAFKGATALTSSVAFTVERKDRAVYVPSAAYVAQEAESFFGAVVASSPVSHSLTVNNPDPSFTGSATLEVVLQGGAYNIQGRVRVQLNGTTLGEAVVSPYSPSQPFRFAAPHASLVPGANTVTLTALNGTYDINLLVATRLTYQHLLSADDGLFEASLPPASEVAISGFPTSAIRALDVTDPLAPAALGVKVSPNATGFVATIATPRARTNVTVLIFSDNRVLGAPEMVPNIPSSWSTSDRSLSADLVIVTNAAFAAEADRLAAARNAGSVATVVVDVEDVYDEYGFGVRSPQAIRDFLLASARWKKAPRFALLVGDATSDPRNYLATGSNDFIPTRLVTTTSLRTASDDWFTDFNNDGVADLPIGRLPVRTTAEAATVVEKIASRGVPSGTWASSALLISDAKGSYDFPQTTTDLLPLFPSTLATQTLTIGETATPKETVVGALNAGHLLVNYFGHGDVEKWSTNVFTSADATTLVNGNQLPVAVLIACYNGYFHRPGSRSLAEALIQAPNGGAVAVWAASTLTPAYPETVLNQELYKQLFGTTYPTIGEAMKAAKLAITDQDVRKSYILFGDPSMKLR